MSVLMHRSFFAPLVFFSIPIALIACNGKPDSKNDEPVPVAEPPKPAAEPSKAREASKKKVAVVHTVSEGETLWDIARAYGITVEELLKANGLKARDVRRLSKGATLEIPNATEAVEVETAADRAAKREALPPVDDGAYHFLRRGENAWTLARLYDVPVEEIMERNGFSDDDLGLLRIGQPVIVPGIDKSKVEQAKPMKRVGLVHELVEGETIWDISRAFQVSVAELMATNALSAREVTLLREGTRLLIPGVEEDRGGGVRRKISARERRATAAARRLGLGTRRVASALMRGRVERRWMSAAGGFNRLEGTLRWPVTNGWFVRGFGSGEGGYHLAVDIMGKIGWNVRAAARGIVGYSGNEVRGYGNMVLVIHPGGWVTMYAHNSVNFVAAGEKVAKGAVLAELGSTGISRGPHVHFELIHKGKNCDPALLFRPGIRHRNGKISPLKYLKWTNPSKPPAGIRCAPRRRHPRSRWVIHE
jgi:murein DD-endopeptidase MepM/ murein hydrolase activator NlpD